MDNRQPSGRPLLARYIDFIEYGEAWELQKEYVAEIDRGERAETLLLLQHPPTYTLGTDRHPEHLLLSPEELGKQGIGVFEIDRGGDITYHGPGQLVGYPLMYLDAKGLDLHGFLRELEQVIIDWLADYGIEGGRKSEYTGVWVGDEKIAAIGIKFNKARKRRGFVTSHGFALNIKAGIAEQGFSGIIPCGIQEYGVTSFEDLTGIEMSLERAAREILPHFMGRFGFDPASAAGE
ncbi:MULTISPECIES: lipoyl(octanoyl) transferase LipB [unclassified Paenibacillus]|uniref:lipoyl(octanoyl) transferase LipB n=1 Tax=unclassified Paenibacillus TaxID=185978 RepID=UPI0009573E0C|nr:MULTISPECIES: lipoyl(octanoyl) transferase LipB [unclassified Paenibacillus]ASS65057.1 lipoyl(octanoyl) transferase LipB [Paenibacillus sp. RUD330]SIQ50155.1 lipoyl(octanoyl) transferase [Paenibacillus sp. RU4X]SIQ72078.1 lipoyl(octanoyl) transferase [Paenibacillus sp. RU4T]